MHNAIGDIYVFKPMLNKLFVR